MFVIRGETSKLFQCSHLQQPLLCDCDGPYDAYGDVSNLGRINKKALCRGNSRGAAQILYKIRQLLLLTILVKPQFYYCFCIWKKDNA